MFCVPPGYGFELQGFQLVRSNQLIGDNKLETEVFGTLPTVRVEDTKLETGYGSVA